VTVYNLTPHDINVVNDQNEIIATYRAYGAIARLEVSQTDAGTVDGIPVKNTMHGTIVDLPVPTEGAYYLVSMPVAQAVQAYRADVLAPDTGPSAYRVDGKIVGVRSFTRYTH